MLFPNDTVGMPAQEMTLAEALKAQGYATGIIGKWHLGDAPDVLPTRHGFDYWYGLAYSNDMNWGDGHTIDDVYRMIQAEGREAIQEIFDQRRSWYFEPKVENWNSPLMRSSHHNGAYVDEVIEKPTDQRTLTKRSTEEAVAFIERHQDEPFLLYVPYSMPHTPIFRSEEFAGRSLGGRYGDVIEELDASAGAIVATLEALELAQNTLFVFTSDNGPWLTMDHHGGTAGLLRHGKGTTFEGGMRVPGIFWWPGQIQPGVVSDMGATLDLFVTALNLAGGDASSGVDGYDLTGTLLRGEPSPRDELAYYRSGELRAYRKGEFKLHLVTEGAYSQSPVRTVHESPLLYRLSDDPSERFDVAEQHPDVVEAIQSAIEAHRAGLKEQPPLFDERLKRLLSGP